MTKEVIKAVNQARKFFEIEGVPGNFFELLDKNNSIEKYRLILFKEDIGKLSGFIGYGEQDLTVICINYWRSIGHQNFTLAHEIGHWFMHKGQSLSDDTKSVNCSTDKREKEANMFAQELLYPEEKFKEDYLEAVKNDLFKQENRKELAIYVDKLCHRYTISFEMALRRLLYCHKLGSQYKSIHKQIEKALGCKISEKFTRDFYIPNSNLYWYKQYEKSYKELKRRVDMLVKIGKIGEATADSIKHRNDIEP